MREHGVHLGRMAPVVTVSDMERALGFYEGALGMTKTFANGAPVRYVILRRDDAEVHLSLDRDHEARACNVVHLLVTDAAALHGHLAATGAHIVKGLRDEVYGVRDFIVADPDGNRIDIGQPLR